MLPHSSQLLDYYLQTDRGEGQFIVIEIYNGSNLVYTITEAAISGNSLSVSRRGVSNSSFRIGEAYISEAKFTVIDEVTSIKQDITGYRVKIYTGVQFTPTFRETVQIFEGIVPTNGVSRKISATEVSVDGVLSLFVKDIGNVTISGTCYDLVSLCCDFCGVRLKQSKAEFNSLSSNASNGYTLFITDETNIGTYRDIVMFVAQIMGCFVDETVDGAISFKSYSPSSDRFSMNIDTVASGVYGDGVVKLQAMTWIHGGKTTYIAGSVSDIYVLELVENPLLDKLDDSVFGAIADNLWNQVKNLNLMYASLEYNGCPLIELGDILSVDKKNIECYVTALDWVYHGKSKIESVSVDPRVNTQQQSVRAAARSGGSASGGGFTVIRYINSRDISIGNSWTQVASTFYSTPSNVTPLILVCATLDMPSSGLLEARIMYDNVEVLLKPKWSMNAGYFTVEFSKSFDPDDVQRSHSLKIYFRFGGTGKVFLERYQLEMNIMASDVKTALPDWSGLYELSDSVPKFKVKGPVSMRGIRVSSPSVSFGRE